MGEKRERLAELALIVAATGDPQRATSTDAGYR
jgi:hypothetical protein